MVSKKEINRRITEAQKLGMTIPEYMKWFREHLKKEIKINYKMPKDAVLLVMNYKGQTRYAGFVIKKDQVERQFKALGKKGLRSYNQW